MASSVIRVSMNVTHARYIVEAKNTLKTHGKVEFHAVGNTILHALKVADRLNELGYSQLESARTSSIEDTRGENSKQLAKMVVVLSKSPRFEAICEEFDKQRASRQSA